MGQCPFARSIPEICTSIGVSLRPLPRRSKLGLSVPFTNGNVSPVWPASGVALASVLLWGYGIWPGIALAAFFANFLSPIPTVSCIGIAHGNTSSALVGGYLGRRFINDRPSFERLRDVFGLLALGAAIAPIIAASVGVTTLLLTHVRAWSGFGPAWQVWWLGDVMGVLIITPMFFVTSRELTRSFKTHRPLSCYERHQRASPESVLHSRLREQLNHQAVMTYDRRQQSRRAGRAAGPGSRVRAVFAAGTAALLLSFTSPSSSNV